MIIQKSLGWNSELKLLLIEKLSERGNKIYYGCRCIFVPITKDIGVKLFLEKSNRDFAFRNQKRASQYEVGPEVGDKFKFSSITLRNDKNEDLLDVKILHFFGYVTERVTTVKSVSDEEYDGLCLKLKKHGFSTHDLHEGNLGRMNGKLICIDFDEVSQS